MSELRGGCDVREGEGIKRIFGIKIKIRIIFISKKEGERKLRYLKFEEKLSYGRKKL